VVNNIKRKKSILGNIRKKRMSIIKNTVKKQKSGLSSTINDLTNRTRTLRDRIPKKSNLAKNQIIVAADSE
jgi:hypothetical protein